jgi:hypothetical protein
MDFSFCSYPPFLALFATLRWYFFRFTMMNIPETTPVNCIP